jgi:RND family efflux transporter MFP subunit
MVAVETDRAYLADPGATMRRVHDRDVIPPGSQARRRYLGWALVVAAAAAVVVSFAFSTEDDAASQPAGGPRATPVAVAPVERATIVDRRRYPGELDATAADVAAFYAGRLLAVNVRVGDTVAAGAVLAELDPVDAREQIAQAEAQATAAAAGEQRARVEHHAAEVEAERIAALADRGIVSRQEIDTARARAAALKAQVATAAAGEAEARARVRLLEKRIAESRVRAPFAGRVAARYVDPGAIVTAGARLVRVVAEAPLWVRFEVPEQDVGSLATGSTVRVNTDLAAAPAAAPEGRPAPADPAVGTVATITGVAGEVDRAERTVLVEAKIDAPPPFWLPGMYAEAVVARRTLEDALAVPGVALVARLGPEGATGWGVFVIDGGVARWVPVSLLAREGERAAVSGDLAEGARVLVAGHADLSDGSPITLAEAAR